MSSEAGLTKTIARTVKMPKRRSGATMEIALAKKAADDVTEVTAIDRLALLSVQCIRRTRTASVSPGNNIADCRQASTKMNVSSAPMPQMTNSDNPLSTAHVCKQGRSDGHCRSAHVRPTHRTPRMYR